MEPTEFTRDLGHRIRSLRQAMGFSQEKLAETAGIHPTYVSEIELGKANASITIFARVASGLGMSLSELVEIKAQEDDAALSKFIFQVKGLDKQERKVFLETAGAVLKGMREF